MTEADCGSEEPGLVSVVILTLNRKDDLLACLGSVFRQDYPSIEVLVVDNGSEDGTVGVIRGEFPQVLLVENRSNRGSCVPRNDAVLRARGEFVWCLDSDTEVLDSGFLSTLVRTLQAHPEIGGIGGEAVLDEANHVVGVKRLHMLSNAMPRGEQVIGTPFGQLIPSDILVTANLFIRRRHMIAVGGFDPSYFFFMEDQDLSYRIRKSGLRTVVFGRTQVFHKFSPVSRVLSYTRSLQNRTYFVLKHFSFLKMLLLPFYDLMYLADPENYRRSLRFVVRAGRYGSQAAVRAGLAESGSVRTARLSGWLRLLRLGLSLPVAMVFSYVTVLPKLPNALKLRFQGEQHLVPTWTRAAERIGERR